MTPLELAIVTFIFLIVILFVLVFILLIAAQISHERFIRPLMATFILLNVSAAAFGILTIMIAYYPNPNSIFKQWDQKFNEFCETNKEFLMGSFLVLLVCCWLGCTILKFYLIESSERFLIKPHKN